MAAVTIPELPGADVVDPAADYIVISHQGVTYRTTFSALLNEAFLVGLVLIPTNLAISKFLLLSSAVIKATGTGQSSAAPLTASRVVVNDVSPGAGVILPDLSLVNPSDLPVSVEIAVLNRGANAVAVYPQNGGQIETLQVDSPSGIAPGGSARFLFSPEGIWRIS